MLLTTMLRSATIEKMKGVTTLINSNKIKGRMVELGITQKEMAEKIPKIKIGKHGQIMEWMKDYDEAEPGHRHISHLWALHPAFQITPDNTPDLCDAAKITLQRRLSKGGGHTGWGRGL